MLSEAVMKCEICNENEAKFTCPKCDEHFCASCDTKWHNSTKRREHRRHSYLGKIPSRFCAIKDHEDSPLVIFCQPCSKLICANCSLLQHKTHFGVPIRAAVECAKSELTRILDPLQKEIKKMDADVNHKEAELHAMIKAKAQEVHAAKQLISKKQKDLEETKELIKKSDLEAHIFLSLAYGSMVVKRYPAHPLAEFGCTLSSKNWENGLFYFLGTQTSKDSWVNPHQVTVNITPSSEHDPINEPWSRILANTTGLRCISKNEPNQWVTISLLTTPPSSFALSHYAIKSRGDHNSNHPRYWVLEGSVDQRNWVTLSTHRKNDDNLLTGLNSIGKWSCQGEGLYFTYFRITQTGKNSTNANYLIFQNIEFYGKLR